MSMTPKGYERISTLSPEQRSLLDRLLPELLGNLGQEGIDKFAAPYERYFRERTVPGIAERFSGMGAGAQSSSAFSQALGQAGASLSEQLAGIGAQRGQQGISNILNLLGQSQEGLMPKEQPFWQQILKYLLSNAQQAGQTASSALPFLV